MNGKVIEGVFNILLGLSGVVLFYFYPRKKMLLKHPEITEEKLSRSLNIVRISGFVILALGLISLVQGFLSPG